MAPNAEDMKKWPNSWPSMFAMSAGALELGVEDTAMYGTVPPIVKKCAPGSTGHTTPSGGVERSQERNTGRGRPTVGSGCRRAASVHAASTAWYAPNAAGTSTPAGGIGVIPLPRPAIAKSCVHVAPDGSIGGLAAPTVSVPRTILNREGEWANSSASSTTRRSAAPG